MKRYRAIIIILILTVLLAVSSLFGWLSFPKNIFWRTVSPVGAVLKVSFGRVPKTFTNIFEINRILKQNHDLINENLNLQSQLAQLNEVSYENEILKKELKFSQSQSLNMALVPSAIIGRASGYLKSVVIDKGEKDGVVKGQAVVSEGFLVGIIKSVQADSAEVTLVTDYNSLVPAILQDSRGTGLLRGGLEGLVVEDIPLNIGTKNGESVVTSGLGGQIPAGLVIGKVQNLISKPGEIFQKVSIGSPIDFSRLEVLFVVKK
ncbi:MAG: rod shape-determining protein MreC [Candidatus Berkelbacteria bacterium]